MMKTCVLDADGNIINIGDWDYQYRSVEVTPAVLDDEGNVISEAVYEDQPANPLPDGATTEERDFEYDADRGWYVVGIAKPPTVEERLQAAEDALTALLGL